MKLWQKDGISTNEAVALFTVGRDKEFDLLLAAYDVQGSLAHTEMLASTGLLTAEEKELIHRELKLISVEIAAGDFVLEEDIEDVHSQIEVLLTRRIGEAGMKIHSGRSRNDQIAVDIKLYLRDELKQIKTEVLQLFHLLIQRSEQFKAVAIPGYTHMQVAMPSSIGLWLGAYAESLVDDMALLTAAYSMANKNPLGSGAGYGSSLPLNRMQTTELLQFKWLHFNSIYAQMSRGKTEKMVAIALAGFAATLARFSMDACMYSSQDLGFISFPTSLTTGSSIMPHKKNPDVLELVRAKCNRLQSIPNEMSLLLANLPSGYHRDLQLTKEILFPAIEELKACVQMTMLMLTGMEVNDKVLEQEKYRNLFSVEEVNKLVLKGIPFREAYRQVAKMVENGTLPRPILSNPDWIAQYTHEGSIGNLCNEQIMKMMDEAVAGC